MVDAVSVFDFLGGTCLAGDIHLKIAEDLSRGTVGDNPAHTGVDRVPCGILHIDDRADLRSEIF